MARCGGGSLTVGGELWAVAKDAAVTMRAAIGKTNLIVILLRVARKLHLLMTMVTQKVDGGNGSKGEGIHKVSGWERFWERRAVLGRGQSHWREFGLGFGRKLLSRDGGGGKKRSKAVRSVAGAEEAAEKRPGFW